MFDENTERLLREVLERCREAEFRRLHGDICMAARIATLNVRGSAVKLRPSLLGLENLSEIKIAANVLKRIREVIGPVASAEVLKWAAAEYVYRRLREAV